MSNGLKRSDVLELELLSIKRHSKSVCSPACSSRPVFKCGVFQCVLLYRFFVVYNKIGKITVHTMGTTPRTLPPTNLASSIQVPSEGSHVHDCNHSSHIRGLLFCHVNAPLDTLLPHEHSVHMVTRLQSRISFTTKLWCQLWLNQGHSSYAGSVTASRQVQEVIVHKREEESSYSV